MYDGLRFNPMYIRHLSEGNHMIDEFELQERLPARFNDLWYYAGLSMRYHKARQWWYAKVSTLLNFLAFGLATYSITLLTSTSNR